MLKWLRRSPRPLVEKSFALHPVEALIARSSPPITLVFGALLLLMQLTYESSDPGVGFVTHKLAPAIVIASVVVALWLALKGRPRWGIALVIILCYVNLVIYVVMTGYGVKSYSLSLYVLSIVSAGLIIGPRAGIVATAVGMLTVVALYAADQHLRFTNQQAIAAIPAAGAMAIYVTLFLVAGLTNIAFGRTFSDVLRRAQAQEAQLRAQFEVSPVGHVIHRDGRVIMANEAVWRRLGLTRAADLVGRSLYDFVPPEDHGRVRAQFEDAWQAVRPVPQEYRAPMPGGRHATLATYVVPVALPDGPALMSIMLDVTRERRAAAELAVARDQAEAANRAKSAFLANMSHEIRTPLNGIIGLAQMVLEPDMPPGEREHHLRQIVDLSRSLHGILTDVLDLSKIEAGKLEFEHTAFDLRRELNAVGELYAAAAHEKGLDFTVMLDSALSRWVLGDSLRLRQIVGNLLSNSVKFTESGGVTLTATALSPEAFVVKVIDTGVGIDEAARARLFQPFEQADTSTTRRFGGTGLGLALCRQLVDLMGGRISVDSELGRGSTFTVELAMPRADTSTAVAERIAAPLRAPEEMLKGRHVLLVEDNAVNEIVAVAALERLGIATTVAHNGAEAVDAVLLEDEKFDAVLMDLQMPDMDGYEATARIRAHHGPERLPIIAMTAAVLVEERQQCIKVGMNDFVSKPFDLDQLAGALARCLPRQRANV